MALGSQQRPFSSSELAKEQFGAPSLGSALLRPPLPSRTKLNHDRGLLRIQHTEPHLPYTASPSSLLSLLLPLPLSCYGALLLPLLLHGNPNQPIGQSPRR